MTDPSFPLPNWSADLSGQVALVTGTSSGLGRRFAQVLAASGAKVALAARRVERLEELAAEITGAGGEALPLPLDMTATDTFAAAVDQAESALGPVTILVNNAGIPDAQYATRMSPELTLQVITTNFTGPWMLSCEVARRLIAAKSPGRIINVSSMGAFHYSGEGAALYSTTKAAVVRMTETLAVEWSRFNINVNAIAPGAFSSEMMDGMLSRLGDISRAFPRKRIADPALLDSTLLYLVSPASEAVTGAVMKVDDGQGGR